MSRQRLPRGITKTTVTNRRTGRPEDRWRVKLNPVDAAGARHQVNRSFATEKEARAFHAETLGAVQNGAYVAASKRTVEQACADWLTSKHRIKASTARGYRVSLQPVRDELGSRPVQRLEKADVDGLVQRLRAGEVEGRRQYTPRSVNQMLGLLMQVLASEQAQGKVVRNVAQLVDRVPADPKKYRTLTEKEILRVIDHGSRDRALWALALYGLRRGEIAGLRWEHVDLKAGTVAIVENRVAVGKESIVGTPKSKASRRTLPLPDDALAALKAARKQQQRERLALGEAYGPGEYVACDEAGQPLTPATLTFRWGRMLDGLKIERVRLHDARHSCATLMHLRGVPIAVIAAWLGHSSAAFTMATYAHSQDEALKAAGQSFRPVEAI
ncbi:site-specific integrase [Tsukamurella conjunctivitidis]|uniref:Site-specific integrase n=1 Tax=Tsukamurella conjunctivitidis TaxID=2592068 RepID=A0A5C5S311_9ACTN|nr:tyrosine-type recombinase/integrase [Tsukamurella conjunctivitidis]TWS29018.1 site-specific integrase [Tsukamurella conjunctivitidis]